MRKLILSLAAMALASAPFTAFAAEPATGSWADLKPVIYGDKAIQDGTGVIQLDTPYRATDDREVPVSISVDLGAGRSISRISLLIDENPMPVSAVLTMDEKRASASFAANMRINGPTPVRAIVEANDGQIYMTEGFIKTSGLGACAAPPVGDPAEAIASIGQMQLQDLSDNTISTPSRRARLEMKHPQHTGLQMNQITLLYILARYIDTVEVWNGDSKLYTLTGSISLSEDPEIEFDYPNTGAAEMRVRMTDTEGDVFEKTFSIAPGA